MQVWQCPSLKVPAMMSLTAMCLTMLLIQAPPKNVMWCFLQVCCHCPTRAKCSRLSCKLTFALLHYCVIIIFFVTLHPFSCNIEISWPPLTCCFNIYYWVRLCFGAFGFLSGWQTGTSWLKIQLESILQWLWHYSTGFASVAKIFKVLGFYQGWERELKWLG